MPNKIISRSVKPKKFVKKVKQISKTKQGVDTAAKMREKISKMKEDEDIASVSEDEE